jgi:hypothetical protein
MLDNLQVHEAPDQDEKQRGDTQSGDQETATEDFEFAR